MVSFGIVLAVVAVLDIVLAAGRRTAVPSAVAAAALAGPTAAALGALVTGHSPRSALVLAATVLVVEVPVWTFARRGRRPALALAAVLAVLAGRLVTTPLWWHSRASLAEEWSDEMGFAFGRAGSERIVLVLGAAAFLATAGNTVVRLLLRSLPGVDLGGDGRLPGGGRVIGSLERLLIFGLALSGEATAAALVVSAKGVLRFAEVRNAPDDDVDRVTEYVLVGSLASYALAMAFVPLAAAY